MNRSHSPSRGFLYVAYGEKFVAEAALSAIRCGEIHGIACVLVTNSYPGKDIEDAFDQIIITEFRRGYDDKLLMALSPFEETIFIDTDTYILAPLDQLFNILHKFDLAVQFTPGGQHYRLPCVPDCFTEPSAGIIVWRRSERMDAFFERWRVRYRNVEEAEGHEGAWDQRSLRWALWESDVRFCNIPAEYQCNLYKPEVCLGGVRMLHGRKIPKYILHQLNLTHNLRVYVPKIGILPIYYEATIFNLCIFVLRSLWLIFHQIIRRSLHHTNIMPFPAKTRPD
jgi:hypothetical protein